jgi:hypothetical protein
MPWRQMGEWKIPPPLLTSALDGGEWLASRPCRFTHREIPPVHTGQEAGYAFLVSAMRTICLAHLIKVRYSMYHFFAYVLLATWQILNLEEHPLSAICDWFVAALCIWRLFPWYSTRGRAIPWWQETHVTISRLFKMNLLRKAVYTAYFSFSWPLPLSY